MEKYIIIYLINIYLYFIFYILSVLKLFNIKFVQISFLFILNDIYILIKNIYLKYPLNLSIYSLNSILT